jgi:hypothetical protein
VMSAASAGVMSAAAEAAAVCVPGCAVIPAHT